MPFGDLQALCFMYNDLTCLKMILFICTFIISNTYLILF